MWQSVEDLVLQVEITQTFVATYNNGRSPAWKYCISWRWEIKFLKHFDLHLIHSVPIQKLNESDYNIILHFVRFYNIFCNQTNMPPFFNQLLHPS